MSIETMTIIIKPIQKDVSNVSFLTAFPYNGKTRVWKDDNTLEDVPTDGTIPTKRKIVFSKTKIQEKLSIPLEKGKPVSEAGRKMLRIYEDFLCNHPSCLLNSKRHAGSGSNPLFDVIDVSLDTKNKVSEFDYKLRAMNMVNEMKDKTIEDVLYWYGQSPRGLSRNSAILELVGEKGYCLGNAKEFVDAWGGGSSERDFVVTIRKALDKGVISKRSMNGVDGYYVGESTWVGITFEDIVEHMKKDDKVYKEHVLREIAKSDEYDSPTNKENAPTHTIEEITALRDEAKELKALGYIKRNTSTHLMSFARLSPLVDDARKKRDEAESDAVVVE